MSLDTIVTTEGAIPVHIVKNDGVCTISSMKYRKDMQHKEIPYNHYEIMNSPEVVNTVNKKLKSNFIYFGGINEFKTTIRTECN